MGHGLGLEIHMHHPQAMQLMPKGDEEKTVLGAQSNRPISLGVSDPPFIVASIIKGVMDTLFNIHGG